MTEIKKMYENCNYRFKGKSCTDCPLKCKGKEYEPQRLKQENEKYKQFIQWLSTQQYYILPKNIKEKIKEILNAR